MKTADTASYPQNYPQTIKKLSENYPKNIKKPLLKEIGCMTTSIIAAGDAFEVGGGVKALIHDIPRTTYNNKSLWLQSHVKKVYN